MANVMSMSTSLYSMLKSEILKDDPAFEVYEAARKWVDRMLDYKMPKGKLILGLPLVESYMTLKEGTELTHDEIFLACTLGWCFECLQAYFIVLDDIISESDPKKGRPGWYKVQKVGNFAVNDWILLRNHIAIKERILRKYYRHKPYYVQLVDLFNEVEFQINSGRLIEAISTLDSEKKLSKFTMSLGVITSIHRRSAKYKRSYYLFYFPVACALLLSGEKLENHLDVKDILVEMSIYYQTQDDYLNCFGDPKVLGKEGTDIEDFKCSWLVVKALELCSEEQKKVLYVNYGKKYPVSTTRVKALYKELNLQDVFNEYESKTYEKLTTSIQAIPNKAIQSVLKSFLAKIQ